jgi:hypothetical protein
MKGLKNTTSIDSQDFLDACKAVPPDTAHRLLNLNVSKAFERISLVKVRVNPPEKRDLAYTSQWGPAGVITVYNPPMVFVTDAFMVKGLQAFGFVHHIKILDRTSKKQCHELLMAHVCREHCLIVAFDFLPQKRQRRPLTHNTDKDDNSPPYMWLEYTAPESKVYPPRPTTW